MANRLDTTRLAEADVEDALRHLHMAKRRLQGRDAFAPRSEASAAHAVLYLARAIKRLQRAFRLEQKGLKKSA